MKIGIDLGGSHIAIGVVDNQGRIIEKQEKRLLKKDKENIKKVIEEYIVQTVERFEKEYSTFACSEIQKKLYGKSYKMYIPEEKAQFLANGGHGPNGCTQVVAKAAVWTAEILEEEGLLNK